MQAAAAIHDAVGGGSSGGAAHARCCALAAAPSDAGAAPASPGATGAAHLARRAAGTHLQEAQNERARLHSLQSHGAEAPLACWEAMKRLLEQRRRGAALLFKGADSAVCLSVLVDVPVHAAEVGSRFGTHAARAGQAQHRLCCNWAWGRGATMRCCNHTQTTSRLQPERLHSQCLR